jgi:hypothetical protein
MKRIHADHETGQVPDYVKRSIDLARETLKDLGCMDKAEIICCWGSQDMRAPQALRIPLLRVAFEERIEMLWDPSLCRLSKHISQPAFTICLQDFATGGIYGDDIVKYKIREQMEGYLGTFTLLPGISEPKHFRLTEHDYA